MKNFKLKFKKNKIKIINKYNLKITSSMQRNENNVGYQVGTRQTASRLYLPLNLLNRWLTIIQTGARRLDYGPQTGRLIRCGVV
jgi:hypothetical protein